MLVRLDFGQSDDKFFQVGKSVTAGNFIWTPYTTMSWAVHKKHFANRSENDDDNGRSESEDSDNEDPEEHYSEGEASDDQEPQYSDTGLEDESPDEEGPEGAGSDDENHARDDSHRWFFIYVECKPIDPTMSFECIADIDVIEHGYYGNSSAIVANLVFNDIETKSKNLRECYNSGNREASEFSVCVNVKSFEIFPTKCFTSPKPNLTDIELIIGDKTFYASKHILAQHSKKFYEMIYGGDQSVDKLEIKDVSPEDFLLFLEVLYDCEKGVRSSSIEKIAGLSILYESTKCFRKCELFLIRLDAFNRDRSFRYQLDDQDKIVIQYCQKYGFKTLLHQMLQSLNTAKIREAIEKAEKYSIGGKLVEALSARLAELKVEASEKEVGTDVQLFIDKIDQASIDFSVLRDNLTDIVLSVRDKKYHVSKQILANASAYFYAMFYGNFNEKDENVIELKDVDPDEFEEFLQHVYNPDRNHNVNNIEFLIKLSHFFDASYNLRQCQKYILNSDSFNDAQKIYMARKYHLTYLFDQVVFKYQNMDDLKKLTSMDDFKKLDRATIGDITMKILENHTGSKTHNF